MLWTQICQKRHFEAARLFVAFYHEFKDFVHVSVNWDD